MGLFTRRRRETRDLVGASWAIPTNGSLGWNYSGQQVTPDRALRLSAVYACVSLIADALSTMPIDVYRKEAGRRVPIEPTPTIVSRPAPDLTQVEWYFQMLASLLLRGNAYGLKEEFDRDGYPRTILPLSPDTVTVDRDEQGRLRYRILGGRYPREQIFHVRAFVLPGMDVGLSPVQYFAQTIGLGLAAEEYGARFFGDGGHPTAVLKSEQPVNQDQAKQIKQRWSDAVGQRRGVAVLGAGLDYAPVQVSPEDSQFLDSQRFTVTQIGRIFKVPAAMLDAAVEGSSLTYGNREQDDIRFQTRTLLPWAVRLEQSMNELMPRPRFMKFNMDASLRIDLKTRYEAHSIALKDHWLTIPEVRTLEDLPPLPNGEMFPSDTQQPALPQAEVTADE